MGLISAVLPVVIIILLFFFVVRIATVILKLTGLDEQTARFQAISAFTGTGFTTKEAELILEDRIRRKTTVVLMVLGKVGIVSVITSLFLSFGGDNLSTDFTKAIILLVFIFILYKITTLPGFSRSLNKFIEKKIIARGIVRQTILEEIFHLPKGYGLAKLTITAESNECNRTLSQAGFNKKDILILSIERKSKLIPFPRAQDTMQENDKLLCYGLIKNIKSYT